MNFVQFKQSTPAQSMMGKLGLRPLLQASHCWRGFRGAVVYYNDPDKGHVVKAARRCDRVCSSGERVLLHAILHATDFSWLADELDKRKTWRNMEDVSGEWRRAVAACIAQID